MGRYCEQLARAASRRGHEVVVVAPAYGRSVAQTEEVDGLVVTRFPGAVFKSSHFPLLVWRVYQMLTKSSYDFVHAADWPMVLACRFLKRWRSVDYIATAHGTDVSIVAKSRLSRLILATDAYQQANRTVANSHFTLRLLEKEWSGFKEARVTYLGVDEFWRKDVNSEEIRGTKVKFGLPDSEITVVCVGRFDERKGQDRLLAALSGLDAEIKARLCCVFVGNAVVPDFQSRVEQLALKSGVKVRFLSGVTDNELRAILAGSDIFCLPGRRVNDGRIEGFGLAYLEASAQGLPCIGPREWAVPEVVAHGRTGLLCDIEDDAALASALNELVRNEDLRGDLKKQAVAHAASFTWDRCAAETYDEQLRLY